MTCMTIRTQVASREMALSEIKQSSQLQQPTASHFKMSTSYDNNSNYSIYVMAYERGFPEHKELASPCVSICWNVIRSYKSDNLRFKPSIEDYNSEHTDHDVFASISSPNYKSPQSRETISGLISRINFPFQLDRLSWRGLSNTVKPLDDVDDMISHILELISGMVDKGRRKVDLNVQVKMQYTLPHEEYEAKVRARKERDLTEDLIRLTADLQSHLAGMENPHGAMARMTLRYYHDCRKRIEDEMRASNISPEMTMSDPRLLEMEAAIRESFDQAVVVKSRPASKASVEALERFVMDDEDGGSSSRSSVLCVICQEYIVTGSEVIRLPCSQSHTFHGDCIIQYLKGYAHTCPLCKFKLPEELNDLPQKRRRTN